MKELTRLEWDEYSLQQSIRDCKPIEVKTYTLPHEMEVSIIELLSKLLKEINHPEMTDYLTYCLRELMVNGKKANTKRVFFQERNYDLENEEHYDLGMQDFKKETLSNINYYLERQRDLGLYIKTSFHFINNQFIIEVRNNSKLTLIEYKRMHDKFARAQQYTSVNEPLTQVMDNAEGAGLGIVILVIMLRKIGLSDDGYRVFVDGEETVVKLTLDLSPTE
ncbi:MAG: hypothetical protein ACRC4W_04355 [Treponemataceae bacterium]